VIKVGSSGPVPAKILIIGEAPGKEEEKQCKPFVGASGSELTKMLNEAGILRTECRVTNVCKYRPPNNNMEFWWPKKQKNKKSGKDIQIKSHITKDMVPYDGDYFDPRVAEGLDELRDEIRVTQPNVIVPLGNLPLWATTRNSGITKWRSSLLQPHASLGAPEGCKVIPAIHPAAVLRKWDWRYLSVHDFRRVARWKDISSYPILEENFIVKPDYSTVISTLEGLLRRVQSGEQVHLAVDIETSKRHLACIGIAWSRSGAICIPFTCLERLEGYWSHGEECSIVMLLRDLLTHPNALCIGQNWQYDSQYIAKYWGFEVNLFLDIMSEHHTLFPGLPKGLDFQSSMYTDIHVYWKDEGKERGHGSDEQWWIYNCKDCVRTYEIADVLLHARERTQGSPPTSYGQPYAIQQRLSVPIARASMRGVRVDHDLRRRTAFVLQEDIASAETWINDLLGHPFNCNSPQQVQRLFYGELGQTKILNRKTHKPTTDAEALDTIAKRDILLRPICHAINHVRSLRQCLSVCLQPTDSDARLRCQYNLAGTETFRFSSSTDPFGFGTNLQNITLGERAENDYPLPNLRQIIVPDVGFVIGEFDLPQADARVVAWESGEQGLIDLFLDPTRHLHFENAEAIFGKRPASKHEIEYYYAKQGVHLTNYGGKAQVLAHTLGIPIAQAEEFQSRWFQKRPKIREWQNKVSNQLSARRYVENVLGYRRFYFDRIEGLLKEALAWIPQSTVGIVTNLMMLAIEEDPTFLRNYNVQLLLQTHDSLTYQWPIAHTNTVLPLMQQKMTITLPYQPRPLVFTPDVKLSTKSWGDVEERKAV